MGKNFLVGSALRPNIMIAGNPQGYPTNVSLSIDLEFTSFEHIRKWMDRERPAKHGIADPSYPKYLEQQRMWVKAIITALHNEAEVTDGSKLKKQWEKMVVQEKMNIEITAWKFLVRVTFTHT